MVDVGDYVVVFYCVVLLGGGLGCEDVVGRD